MEKVFLEKTLKEATLVFLVNGDGEVCLAVKARNIGKGCRNGYGGGVEFGESVSDAAMRELHAESGVLASAKDLERVAMCIFRNRKTDGFEFNCCVHVFILRAWQGEPAESKEEMLDPQWFKISDLPIDAMMLADRVWVPSVLSGRKLIVAASYGPFQKKLLKPVFTMEVSAMELQEESMKTSRQES